MPRPTPQGPSMQLDLRPTPMVLRLLIVNFAIWMLFSVLVNFAGQRWALDVYDQLTLTPAETVFGLKLWQVGTYMWLHDLRGASHLIFNLLGLFFLGPPLERRWGSRSFLVFYLWSGVIAGLFSVVVGLLLPGWFGGGVVGASGSVLALVAAFSFVMPEAVILLMFVIPVQARWIVWIAVGIDTVIFFSGTSGVAFHTHLGGILGAWLLVTGNWRPRLALDRARLAWLRLRGRRRPRPSGLRVVPGGKKDRRDLN